MLTLACFFYAITCIFGLIHYGLAGLRALPASTFRFNVGTPVGGVPAEGQALPLGPYLLGTWRDREGVQSVCEVGPFRGRFFE